MNAPNDRTLITIHKLRLVPVILFGAALVVVSVMKYMSLHDVGKLWGWLILLTIASYVFAVIVDIRKKEREKTAETALDLPRPPTKEELQKRHDDDMQAGISQQKNNIALRSVYLLFGLLVTLFGPVLIVSNKEYLFGTLVSVVGLLFSAHSVFLLLKWIKMLKLFREERKRQLSDDEIDRMRRE